MFNDVWSSAMSEALMLEGTEGIHAQHVVRNFCKGDPATQFEEAEYAAELGNADPENLYVRQWKRGLTTAKEALTRSQLSD